MTKAHAKGLKAQLGENPADHHRLAGRRFTLDQLLERHIDEVHRLHPAALLLVPCHDPGVSVGHSADRLRRKIEDVVAIRVRPVAVFEQQRRGGLAAAFLVDELLELLGADAVRGKVLDVRGADLPTEPDVGLEDLSRGGPPQARFGQRERAQVKPLPGPQTLPIDLERLFERLRVPDAEVDADLSGQKTQGIELPFALRPGAR